jgi:hypothetical protein
MADPGVRAGPVGGGRGAGAPDARAAADRGVATARRRGQEPAGGGGGR